jgi:hypothetical protein
MKTLSSVTQLTYGELDALVRSTWKNKSQFSSIAEFEWHNGSEYLVEDVGEDKYDPRRWKKGLSKEKIAQFVQYDLDEFNDWINDEDLSTVSLDDILNGLFREGKIPTGHYLISVYW